MIKQAIYKLLHVVTLGKGIPRTFEGNKVRMPTRYFRYFEKGYEKSNFNFINKEVKESMTVLDIGSHIGLMAAVFGKKVGNNGRVFAFEPTPSTVRILRETVRLNHGTNVSVEPYALADQKGKMTFYISDNLADNSNSLANNHRNDRAEQAIEVDVNTVDDFVKERNIPKVDFMKVDVEGAEFRLLKGARQTIMKHKPRMILALHPFAINNLGDSLPEIFDLLTEFGYRIRHENTVLNKQAFIEKKDLFDVFLD
jgi:FkbM family methyltransferase